METEQQLKDLGQVLKYAQQYKTNHIYHVQYQKSKDKEAYLCRHETELILHDDAENLLRKKPLTLTRNWIISTNILTVLRKLQLLTGQRRKIKTPSKFDIKKRRYLNEVLTFIAILLMCVIIPIFCLVSYFMLCIFLYRSFMYFISLSNCILM